MTCYAAFEQVEIVADSHSEGQQFLEPLLRLGKLDRNAAGFEPHPGGEVLKFLIHDSGGCFDQQLGLCDPFLPQLADQPGYFPPALDLIERFIAFGDPLEPDDQGIPIDDAAGSNTADDARRHDLLGAPATDAQEELDSCPVYIRKGVLPQLFQNVGQFTIPLGFRRHGASLCYCAAAQNTRSIERRIRSIILLS
jgi:hypothetical protein